MKPLITVNHLTKKYPIIKNSFIKRLFSKTKKSSFIAVNNISFSISKGEMVAFLGPNGAGKTTTIKMLTGILSPTEGGIEVLGITPNTNRIEYSKKIGVVFGQRTQLWWDLPLKESFVFLQHIYKIPNEVFEQNLTNFKEILDLGEYLDKPVRELSLGQRIRADIAAALIHDPEILFLDEPTIGLDVVAKKKIRDFLVRMNREKNITVILTSHDMDDISNVCERIILIDRGIIINDSSIQSFIKSNSKYRILVCELANIPDNLDALENRYIQIFKKTNNKIYIKFDPSVIQTKDLISDLILNYGLQDLSIQDSNIEDIVREIYESREAV